MHRLETDKFALSNVALPAKAEWQAMSDARNLLFRFELREIRFGAAGVCSALIGGEATTFTCERRPVEAVVDDARAELRAAWTHAYAFRGTGGLTSSVVAGLAWLTYAAGTGGTFFSPASGAFRQWDAQQKGMEAILAVELNRIEAYQARYPEDFRGPPERFDTLVTRIDRNGEVQEHRTPLAPR